MRVAASIVFTIGVSLGLALSSQAASAEICEAFVARLLSAAKHEVVRRIGEAELESGQAIDGLDQRGRLLDLLPATGLPLDPALSILGSGNSGLLSLNELDRPYDLTRAPVELVPDLDVDLSEHYRRILKAPKHLGLGGPQCHLPELTFRAGDRRHPQLRVLKEYRDIAEPDCNPVQYLRMQSDVVSYDLVETRQEVFVFKDTQVGDSNRAICAFRTYLSPAHFLIGDCKSDFCRHVKQFVHGNPIPLYVGGPRGSDPRNPAFLEQIARALSTDRYSVSSIARWSPRTMEEPLNLLLKDAGLILPLSLLEVNAMTSDPQFMGVYLSDAGGQVREAVRFFKADGKGGAEILDELSIATVTFLGGLFEVTSPRSMMFR